MNSMILIRGNKIAFSIANGDFGDGGHIMHDLNSTMMPLGWFIPAVEHGMQVLYMLDKEQVLKPHKTETMSLNVGLKGVMVTLEATGVQYHRVDINTKRQVIVTPLIMRDRGFAILTPYDHLGDIMNVCVRLTTTIEDAVAMYGRHVSGNQGAVRIWNDKEVRKFLQAKFVPTLEARIERLG